MKKRKMKLAFVMMALITSISFVGAVKAVVKINETNISVDNNLFYKVYDNKENNSLIIYYKCCMLRSEGVTPLVKRV